MNHYLRSKQPQVSDSDIDEIEKVYSITFPSAYREFLKVHNGGHPEGKSKLMVHGIFYSIADVPTSLSCAIYERDSDHLIPIGESGNEDQILFDFEDGSIWHLGKKISSSFEDFVEDYLSPI